MASIRFFKIILNTSLDAGHLEIPKKFTMNYGGGLSNPVLLLPPDGNRWKVYWTKRNDGIWFEKGWKEFASHYSLDHGHMVMFEYKQGSHFDVHLFDKSAVEIEYPFRDTLRPRTEQKSVKSPMPDPQPRKKFKTYTHGDAGTSSNPKNKFENVQKKGKQFKGGNNFVKYKVPRSQVLCRMASSQRESFIHGGLKKANEFVHGIGNPYFVAYINSNEAGDNRPCVPSDFIKVDLEKKQDVQLQCGKHLWPLELHVGNKSNWTKGKLSKGWGSFAKNNNIVDGDVCVFELINKKDAVLLVHIFKGHP